MSTCQNGWPAGSSAARVSTLSVAGVSFPGGVGHLDGSAIVLAYVATQWHYRVEKLHKGWCWGFNMRPVRGQSTGYSNHAGGWALDHNAPLHPRGVSIYANLSTKQVATIRAICHEVNSLGFGDIVRWGGDYLHSPKDAMHIEIIGSRANTLKAANKIVALKMNKVGAWTKVKVVVKPTPSVKTARHTVRAATGADVVNVNSVIRTAAKNNDALDVQRVLNRWYPHVDLTEDGVWGDKSYNALDQARKNFGIKTPVSNTAARTKTLQKLGLTVRQA